MRSVTNPMPSASTYYVEMTTWNREPCARDPACYRALSFVKLLRGRAGGAEAADEPCARDPACYRALSFAKLSRERAGGAEVAQGLGPRGSLSRAACLRRFSDSSQTGLGQRSWAQRPGQGDASVR